MPARKARALGKVRQSGEAFYVTVQDVDQDGTGRLIGQPYEVNLYSLSNGEMTKAVSACGGNPRQPGLMELAERQAFVRGWFLANGLNWHVRNKAGQVIGADSFGIAQDEADDNEADDESEAVHEAVHESEAVKAEEPAATDLVSVLNQMIRDVAGSAINEAKVRQIAAELVTTAVDEAVKDLAPRVTTINVAERMVSVDIDGVMHSKFQEVLDLAAQRENVWMVGPAGTGKTAMAKYAADALGLAFHSIQCNPQMPESRLVGFINAAGVCVNPVFRQAFEGGGLFLFDEIDNSHPSTLAALNAALANGEMAFADGMVKKSPEFVALAAANTYGTGATDEYVGRVRIDAATLNRFWKIQVDVDEEVESAAVNQWLSGGQAEDWLALVRRHRMNAASHNLRIIVSMRDAISGAKMIAAGWPMQKCADRRWLAGLSADDAAKVAR